MFNFCDTFGVFEGLFLHDIQMSLAVFLRGAKRLKRLRSKVISDGSSAAVRSHSSISHLRHLRSVIPDDLGVDKTPNGHSWIAFQFVSSHGREFGAYCPNRNQTLVKRNEGEECKDSTLQV